MALRGIIMSAKLGSFCDYSKSFGLNLHLFPFPFVSLRAFYYLRPERGEPAHARPLMQASWLSLNRSLAAN